MATGAQYGRHPFPSGFRHLGLMGPSSSNEAMFLYPFAWRDVIFLFEDFAGGGSIEIGVTDFNEGNWVSETSANGTAFEVKTTNISGGVATGVAGTTSGDTVVLWGDAIWLGDNRAGMEMRFKIDNIDSQITEVGFSDPLSSEKAKLINDIDSPTIENGAADVAVVVRDTAQTFKSLAFITDGSTSNQNATKTDLGTRNFVNTTYGAVKVQLDGNTSFAWVLDENSAVVESASHGALIGSQIEGGVLVRPRFFTETLASADVTIDMDYVAAWQDRIA